jgi:predicted O-methyltransferase YrrM
MSGLKAKLKQILRKFPFLGGLNDDPVVLRQKLNDAEAETARIRAQLVAIERTVGTETLFVPTGHFYSPVPALSQIEADKENIFEIPPAIRGVDLNESRQLELLELFRKFYPDQPFTAKKTASRRYFFENPNFSYADAVVLYCMIRYLRPRRIIEVGSGYSSAAMLDVNELFFDNSISCTFIEPYPQLLRSLLKEGDATRIQILGHKIQDVDANIFRELDESDILFIDSSHVSKSGSDVNYIFFKVLPLLKAGVCIHFHDIIYPFEYSLEWMKEGRSWNETYLLRAFLQYNHTFEIQFFTTYLLRTHREVFATDLPLCLKDEGGNIWLRKKRLDPILDRASSSVTRKPRLIPARVDPSRNEQRWLLGDGWHDGEKDHCWMEDHATFRIAGPSVAGQHLWIHVDNPHREGAHLNVTIENIQLPTVSLTTLGRIETRFLVPQEFVGRPELLVRLDVDRMHSAPNDPRVLGLSIIDMEMR